MKKYLSALGAFVLTSITACTQKPHESITIETSRSDGSVLFLGIDSEDRDQIWIDLNANDTKDEGEELITFYNGTTTNAEVGKENEKVLGEYVVAAQKITIHGPVTTFVCTSAGITEIDLSKALSLRTLVCQYNQIKNLDLSANTRLDTLDCEGNWLSDIDLTPIHGLTFLNISYNKFKNLDLTYNTKLSTLQCSETDLTELDLSKNKALTTLTVIGNELTRLDLGHNPALTKLICMREKIQSLDLRANKTLNYLRCDGCPLTSLELSPEAPISYLFIPDNTLGQEALNKLFGLLSDNPGILCIEGNPGANTADRTIIISKGWAELTKEEFAFSEL